MSSIDDVLRVGSDDILYRLRQWKKSLKTANSEHGISHGIEKIEPL